MSSRSSSLVRVIGLQAELMNTKQLSYFLTTSFLCSIAAAFRNLNLLY